MGIRMHKAIGYGLDIADMNRAVLKNCDLLEGLNRFETFLENVRAYAQEQDDLNEKVKFNPIVLDQMTSTPTSLADMVVYQEEFGLKDKLLLIPFGYGKHWQRYGDLLDAFEYEAYVDFNDPSFMATEWREKPGTLYPFVGLMQANPDKPMGIEEYWESCFLDSEEHKNATPVAPRHLWFAIKALELVPENQITETFLKLRPTFYRYWS